MTMAALYRTMTAKRNQNVGWLGSFAPANSSYRRSF
jgi:hypothetical protein